MNIYRIFPTTNRQGISRLKKYMDTLVYPVILIFLVISCIVVILPENSIFGCEGDWLSQHSTIAEIFRSAFYETGKLIPDCLPLGAGSNSYDFSYYGLLRPDILISLFLPNIPMPYIVSGYAILELAAGTWICYFWLKRHVGFPFFAFLGGVLYSCAACFYHAHHQIMFVNYMPFLLLALWGIESCIRTGRIRLLTIALFLVCLHSYYFAPACLVVCAAYMLFCLFQKKNLPKFPVLCKFAGSAALAIGMAAVLLLPTGLDLLSTSKDAGTPPSLEKIFSLGLGLKSLLYHPYGCGLTILCLYTLLLSLRRKRTRSLSIFLLLCLTVNALSYLLSGFLYVRYKVLIPLVPLLLLLCVQTLEELFTGRERHSLLLGLLCLIPAGFSKYSLGIGADLLWMGLCFGIITLAAHPAAERSQKLPHRSTPLKLFCFLKNYRFRRTTAARTLPLYLLLCLPSLCLFIVLGRNGAYVPAADQRQSLFCQEDLTKTLQTEENGNYRFESVLEPFANTNTQLLPGLGRTSMYSSVTDKNYADFYYNTMRNPIRIRNRVALMSDANPFFSYIMGIRYIQTSSDFLPLGYIPIKKGQNSTVLAENSKTLSIAYTSTSLMPRKEYEKLSFPYTLEALTRYTIVEKSDLQKLSVPNTTVTAEAFMEDTRISPISAQEFSLSGVLESRLDPTEETQLTVPVPAKLRGKLLILSANVTSPSKKEVSIKINGSCNKLSGKDAPYPNHNDTFTWILSSNEQIEALHILLSPGDYSLSHWQIWRMDTADWGNDSAQSFSNCTAYPYGTNGADALTGKTSKHSALLDVSSNSLKFPQDAGSLLLSGEAVLEEPGCAVTSLPYRKGYRIYVNGKEAEVSKVNQTFVGIPLESGVYEISIFYCPPGKIISCWISLISLFLFVGWELYSSSQQSNKNPTRQMEIQVSH